MPFNADAYFAGGGLASLSKAKGGPVLSPRNLAAQLQGPEEQGAQSPSFEGVGEGLEAVGLGAMPLARTVGEYVASRAAEPSRIPSDIGKAGSALVEGFVEDPIGTIAGALPGIGNVMAAADVSKLKEKAKQALAEGDDEKAALYDKLAAAAAIGVVMPVGGGAAARSAAKAGEKAAVREAEKAAESSIKILGKTPEGDYLTEIPLANIEHGESAMPGGMLTRPEAGNKILDYATRKTEMPPIEVVSPDEANGKWMIVDGSHRYEAAKMKGDTSIKSIIAKNDAESFFGGKPDVADHPGMIDTRYPTGKKRIEEVEGERLIADLDALKATPETYEKNVDLLRNYVNMPEHLANGTSDEVAENFINHVKDNLLYIHDKVPEDIRERSQKWYDGANKIATDWAKEYGISDTAASGALAALSPQKDWYQNVSLAKRVTDAIKGNGENFYNGFVFSPEMQKTYEAIGSLSKEEYVPLFDQIKGKSLGDISNLNLPEDEKAVLKAMWVRLYDEAHNSKSYPIINPEGSIGETVKTAKGADARVAWGSMNEISKAIRSLESDGDPALLNEIMGGKHKVRNFYNNILAPNSSRGDVTIDTHAVAAGLLRPLSQKSVEVAHNFKTSAPKGMPGAAGSAASGIQGTYPLYAEAYRRAAQERGILPRQMQSITWEAVRGLFPDTFKTPKNMEAVDALWNKYRAGEASLNETQEAVHDLAGGINNPTWLRPSGAADEAVQGAGNAPIVSKSGVSRKASGGIISRARGGSSSSSSQGHPSAHIALVSDLRKTAKDHGFQKPAMAHLINMMGIDKPRASTYARNILSDPQLHNKIDPVTEKFLITLNGAMKQTAVKKHTGDLRRHLRDRVIYGNP